MTIVSKYGPVVAHRWGESYSVKTPLGEVSAFAHGGGGWQAVVFVPRQVSATIAYGDSPQEAMDRADRWIGATMRQAAKWSAK